MPELSAYIGLIDDAPVGQRERTNVSSSMVPAESCAVLPLGPLVDDMVSNLCGLWKEVRWLKSVNDDEAPLNAISKRPATVSMTDLLVCNQPPPITCKSAEGN